MRKLFAALLCLYTLSTQAQDLSTRYEKTAGQQTATYPEVIQYYQQLSKRFPQINLRTIGTTDAGFPLHLVTYSPQKDFDFNSLRKKNKRIILINNGIHPGEPDGIDASMMLLRDLATGKTRIPDNIILAVIPVYNIGGMLNRSPWYRVDQNGPDAFGFRGNAQNLDLNRDFIKADSKNARAFQQIYQLTDPDVFVDNHVSNGADYQHIMTLLTTQHNKLGGPMGTFLHETFEPGLYSLMKTKGYDLVPYVNHFGETPDSGWVEFTDVPRYSTGYTTLFHTFGFVPETHMLKPYPDRVKATYALMECFIQFTSTHSETIRELRAQTKAASISQQRFPLAWETNQQAYSLINFKGFTSGYKPSAISGLPRLYYDRSKPYERKVKFYNQATATRFVEKPAAYIIPQGWWAVIDLLKNNKVQMRPLQKDTTIYVEVYHITDYKSAAKPFEKHYLHTDIQVSSSNDSIRFRKGDYYIPMNQPANRYLIETLEPTAGDSYFAWNFFDAILGQKEGYSSYVFEDTGAAYLKEHPELQALLAKKKATDTAFNNHAAAQLAFVYKHSPYAEPEYLRYPVYRVR
ncbi:M14 family metallopeptidase [Chitinophaga nivalis]|uniref:M14 family metallopeptidase n=1 Tax=Chitinophaga nivalis TaxID=2991709 RepID=A0ABT3ISF4_9BACT|nr:M14 family metallopeptidase [Chitinophaga nivalis]MCW3463399.1 M14 family metallopeptidase [Chitinophaga nivalis]MCW3486911.1 M14 family metallopeptidase [Chitinophaga nivalis]